MSKRQPLSSLKKASPFPAMGTGHSNWLKGKLTMKKMASAGQARRSPITQCSALLSEEREFDLAWRWRHDGDKHALHELISSHLRLVRGIVKKCQGYGLPSDDLIQEGTIGLLEAANRFEPERGFRFSTFAMWWVRAFVLNYVLRNWSIVKVVTSGPRKSLFFKMQRLRSRIGGSIGGPLSTDEKAALASILGTSVRQVEEMETHLILRDRSLNAPVSTEGEGGQTLQDLVAAPDPSPEQVVVKRNLKTAYRDWLRAALETLSERERTIIEKRWMMEDSSTLKHLGMHFGVSPERVRQIENAALSKLRQAAKSGSMEPMLS
jgi:RNA polymerase sigma-32 factor